ncbi:MAG: HAD hydrolase-like protein [Bdellovibrionales bacterium]
MNGSRAHGISCRHEPQRSAPVYRLVVDHASHTVYLQYMYKAVVFDFDGTLVRSHDEVYKVLAELAFEYRLSLPRREELRNLDTQATIKALGLRIWQVPRFTALARRKLNARLASVQFETGILEVVAEIQRQAKTAVVS